MRLACWYEQIYVVQKPTKQGGYKCEEVTLYIDYKGKNRIEGKQITYKQNSLELESKIEEAYKYAYNRFILGH